MENPGLSVAVGILGGMRTEIPRSLVEKAAFQAGVITRQQALRYGMSRNAITSKVKHGSWRQLYLGIY